MSTNSPRDIQLGFTGFGQVRGVFGSLSYSYPTTATVKGSFSLDKRILRDDGRTEDLGRVAQIDFSFGPQHFGLNPVTLLPEPGAPNVKVYPGHHPATDQPTGRNWPLPVALEVLYSMKRGEMMEWLDRVYPVAPPAPQE